MIQNDEYTHGYIRLVDEIVFSCFKFPKINNYEKLSKADYKVYISNWAKRNISFADSPICKIWASTRDWNYEKVRKRIKEYNKKYILEETSIKKKKK